MDWVPWCDVIDGVWEFGLVIGICRRVVEEGVEKRFSGDGDGDGDSFLTCVPDSYCLCSDVGGCLALFITIYEYGFFLKKFKFDI